MKSSVIPQQKNWLCKVLFNQIISLTWRRGGQSSELLLGAIIELEHAENNSIQDQVHFHGFRSLYHMLTQEEGLQRSQCLEAINGAVFWTICHHLINWVWLSYFALMIDRAVYNWTWMRRNWTNLGLLYLHFNWSGLYFKVPQTQIKCCCQILNRFMKDKKNLWAEKWNYWIPSHKKSDLSQLIHVLQLGLTYLKKANGLLVWETKD